MAHHVWQNAHRSCTSSGGCVVMVQHSYYSYTKVTRRYDRYCCRSCCRWRSETRTHERMYCQSIRTVFRHLPRQSSKNCDLQFANSDRFKENYSIDSIAHCITISHLVVILTTTPTCRLSPRQLSPKTSTFGAPLGVFSIEIPIFGCDRNGMTYTISNARLW